ncbi:hypothetical protein P154DRAFT_522226 [Amniculicola lignicola CBS 123094]|uniref:DUF4604 domain-containing protein n=1 Tax=Amniculicola lignicola CBS 123094 TaxID=1392246 RepID=A0A6A5WJ48_9PLEO|nr:hypothetical protein P154DRAFT_522226 [Amniculicola lignicola CBS 123094]
MSLKAKDLEYDASQPAFLRRLRGELTTDDSARHERPIPRTKRMMKQDEDDDGPTYVMEDGNQSLTKAEYEALVAGDDPQEKEGAESKAGGDEIKEEHLAKQSSTDIKAEAPRPTKKRKVGKVIGGDGPTDEAEKKVGAKPAKKAKKKAKAIKLSFADSEEG